MKKSIFGLLLFAFLVCFTLSAEPVPIEHIDNTPSFNMDFEFVVNTADINFTDVEEHVDHAYPNDLMQGPQTDFVNKTFKIMAKARKNKNAIEEDMEVAGETVDTSITDDEQPIVNVDPENAEYNYIGPKGKFALGKYVYEDLDKLQGPDIKKMIDLRPQIAKYFDLKT